jgi:hypothetical protein
MEKFTTKPKCEKCLSKDVKIRHVGQNDVPWLIDEPYFEAQCNRCEFTWKMKVRSVTK